MFSQDRDEDNKLSEADTIAKLINPALYRKGWTEDFIKREVTAGAIKIIDGVPRQQKKGRADIVLRLMSALNKQLIAVSVIEAKAAGLPPSLGLEQAKKYAKRLHVPFVYATNGHRFVEFDRIAGTTSNLKPLSEFPDLETIRSRYEKWVGFKLDEPVAQPLLTPYTMGDSTVRYYQDAAILAVLEKIARCEKEGTPKRALLSLATGSGKTRIAVHLMKRIAAKLVELVPTLDAFRLCWINPTTRKELLDRLVSAGVSAREFYLVEELEDYDLYDVLADMGYGVAPRTKKERAIAFSYKQADWLSSMPEATAKTVEALLQQFVNGGTEALENQRIFELVGGRKALEALRVLGKPFEVLTQIKERIFTA